MDNILKKLLYITAIAGLTISLFTLLILLAIKPHINNKYDLNSDTKVDLQDVSILIYHMDK